MIVFNSIFISIIVIYTIFFVFYLEFNPTITNIWYRTGVDGNKHVYIGNLFNFITKPLYTKELWNIELLDCNYIFGLIFIFIMYFCISYIIRWKHIL